MATCLGVAGEEGVPVDKLCKDAAKGPDVDGGGVDGCAQQELGRPIHQRHNLRIKSPCVTIIS